MITRKSDGSLMGVKMLYLADQDYHDRRNGDYRTTDFTGNIIYSDLSGRFLFGTRVVNGTEVCAADAAISNRGGMQQVASNGGVTLRECERFRSPTIEICNERGQVFTLDCYNFVITLIWCVSSDLTSRHSGIEPGTILGNGSGNNNNGSNGTNTNVNWGAWQPQNLFSTAQLNQMRTLFYANQLEDLFELLKSTDQQQLRAANNFVKNNNAIAIAALKKYTDEGFTFYEFKDLFANTALFTQSESFLDRNNHNPNSYQIVKAFNSLYQEDVEFREMVTTWPTIPPFMWPIMEDVALEILQKLIKKLNPAAELTQDAINAIRAFRSGSWIDLAKEIAELGWDIAKVFNPQLKLLDVGKEAFSMTKKIKPLIEPLTEIYNKVDAATFGKIYTAMSKITDKGVLDKFGLFVYPNGTRHLQFSGSTKDFFNTIRNEFGVGATNEAPPLTGIYFEVGDIRFTWYPVSGTNDKPTIEIRNGSAVIMKIRQP